MNEIGARIRQVRAEKKVSQDALAESLGVMPMEISRWERGDVRSLRLEQLMQLAEHLDRPVEWLLCGDAWSDNGDAEAEVAEFVRLLEVMNPEIRHSLRRFMEVMIHP